LVQKTNETEGQPCHIQIVEQLGNRFGVEQSARLYFDDECFFDDEIGAIAPNLLAQVEQIEWDFSLDAKPGEPEFDGQRPSVDGFQKAEAERVVGAVESRDDVSCEFRQQIIRIDECHAPKMGAFSDPIIISGPREVPSRRTEAVSAFSVVSAVSAASRTLHQERKSFAA
jgi:hypothetical protein